MSVYLQVEEYHCPQDLGQAVDILSRFGNNVRVIAGGTDILPLRPGVKKNDSISHLVDISKLGMNYLKKENDQIRIGAATNINTICASPLFLSGPYRALAEAADSHSTTTEPPQSSQRRPLHTTRAAPTLPRHHLQPSSRQSSSAS